MEVCAKRDTLTRLRDGLNCFGRYIKVGKGKQDYALHYSITPLILSGKIMKLSHFLISDRNEKAAAGRL